MKKIFAICLAFIAGITAYAQDVDHTFEFCDENGNVIENGANVTFNNVYVDPDDGSASIHAPLFIKSTTDEGGYVSITAEIKDKPNGNFKVCFPNSCVMTGKANDVISTPAGTPNGLTNAPFSKSDGIQDVETAWQDITGYGSYTVTYQIGVYEAEKKEVHLGDETYTQLVYNRVADGSKITATFVYADPAGISGAIDASNKNVSSIYNISGQRINSLEKGINIIKYSDGKTIKVLKK